MIDKSYYTVRDIAHELDLQDRLLVRHIRSLNLVPHNGAGLILIPKGKIQRLCSSIELFHICGMRLKMISILSTKDIDELITKLKQE